ncbi:MAG: MBOAT family protein, partial [Spirochaetota bacterium]|nr:MBOAT family protein [Spirochaetota bacterium]
MLFPTFNFAVFFVIVLIVSWILHKWQIPWKIFLLLASYFFYGSGNAIFLILIIYCSLSSYFFSLQINKTRNLKLKKRYLIFSVVSCLSVLGFFKYFDFFAESFNGLFYGMGLKIPLLEIILPVGISFFTFQAMSYVIDVYRNE